MNKPKCHLIVELLLVMNQVKIPLWIKYIFQERLAPEGSIKILNTSAGLEDCDILYKQ